MLVPLPVNKIAEKWDIFKEVIRESVPTCKGMLPDRMSRTLYAAMTGRLQCWLLYEEDGSDEFYGAMVTRVAIDELTGQKAMLIYALASFKQASRKAREEDFKAFRRFAAAKGCTNLAAYCSSKLVATTTIKANKGRGQLIYYILIPTDDEPGGDQKAEG